MMTHIRTTYPPLADARAVRESVRGRGPHDPERRAALQSVLGTLQASWTPAHEAYMRRGPQIGRQSPRDPVRVLRREMNAEIKRLRSALNRTSGTPRQPAPKRTAHQFRGDLGRAVQVVRNIATEHDQIREHFRGGSWTTVQGGGAFLSMRELNAEAERLLAELTTERRRLNRQWTRYTATVNLRTDAGNDEWDAFEERVEILRDHANLVARELRASRAQRRPDRTTERQRWTRDDALFALHAFEAEHGRMPKRAECRPANGLPHYTQLRRSIGPRPLTRASA